MPLHPAASSTFCARFGQRVAMLFGGEGKMAVGNVFGWLGRALTNRVGMQGEEDARSSRAPSARSIPPASAGREAVLEAAVSSVHTQMDEDRKTTALKSLQVCVSGAASIKRRLVSACILKMGGGSHES